MQANLLMFLDISVMTKPGSGKRAASAPRARSSERVGARLGGGARSPASRSGTSRASQAEARVDHHEPTAAGSTQADEPRTAPVATPSTHWRAAVARVVTSMGYEAVEVERSAAGLLRVTIDRLPGRTYATGASESVTIDDCEAVTHQLRFALEVDAVGYQRLEVSSPGLDRPLRTADDFRRFGGHAVELTLKQPFQGRKRFRGVLMAAAAPVGEPSDQRSDQRSDEPSAARPHERFELLLDEHVGVPERVLSPSKVRMKPSVASTSRASASAIASAKAQSPIESNAVLGFELNEVREARLVPILNFKGRAADKQPAADSSDDE
jgi:ribosome maturation factor RimP